MKKYLFSLALLLFLGLAPAAFAQQSTIKLSPSLLQIWADPPADIQTPFTLENVGEKAMEFTIEYKPFKAADSENGQLTYFEEPLPASFISLKKNIQILDEDEKPQHIIKLGPKQKKEFLLRLNLTQPSVPKDEYFSIVFINKSTQSTSSDKEKVSRTSIYTGIGMNVLVSLGEKPQPVVSLQEFSAPLYNESGPVPFTVRIHNKGVQRIAPKGIMLVKNMFGQTIGRVDLPATNILAASTRAFTDDTSAKIASASVGLSVPVAQWHEKFLIGWYTADLSIVGDENQQLATAQTHFFAFPLTILLVLIIALGIVTTIILRLRRTLKRKETK